MLTAAHTLVNKAGVPFLTKLTDQWKTGKSVNNYKVFCVLRRKQNAGIKRNSGGRAIFDKVLRAVFSKELTL